MQTIIPNLWFNTEAEEAAHFYSSVFNSARVGAISRIDKASAEASGQPEGSVLTVEFEIEGMKFAGLNGGPQFTFNPSISFLVIRRSKEEVDSLWEGISAGGRTLMELGEYPFSKHYGWTADKYGVSWQIMLADEHYPFRHAITPTLMFVGDVSGKAEEAMNFYASTFPDSNVGDIARYPAGMEPDKEGTVMHGAVTLAGQELFAMDSAQAHDFAFNEAVSLIIDCKNQNEVDHFWERLTAHGGQESMCGWCRDPYGVSWQVIPTELPKLIQSSNAMEAMLQMRKIDLGRLREAAEG